MALLPPGLPIQEIWDHILDFIDGYLDLRSCALASRSFTSRTQYHLFHDIVFARPGPKAIANQAYDEVAACNRLGSILAASPHLARHIRRIHIPFCMDVLTHVRGMRLPRLREIEFCTSTSRAFTSVDDPAFANLDLAHGLIALPSIRRVGIHVRNWPYDVTRPGFAVRVMARLFQNPAPHLETLTVIFLGMFDAHGHSELAFIDRPSTSRQ
ncbi:hypothetical protein FB451DRAFT_197788 [Mycena latifolia]|nr:hypothetical protein FB451DRAFT_197788 [Mycena latifolia]